jgi:hypothetical protein
MSLPTLSTFVIGCIGATAPEIVRLYNLRSESSKFQWSWGYVLYSIPFILLGGFIAWILEPSSKYAAFYAGISTPVLVTAVAKNFGQGTSTPPTPSSPPPAPSLPTPSVENQRRGGKGASTNVEAQKPQSIPEISTSRGRATNPISLASFLKALY